MEYNNFLIFADTMDEEMNRFAKDGWLLHSKNFIGVHQMEAGDEKYLFSICMQRQLAAAPAPAKTDRKPIGLGRVPA